MVPVQLLALALLACAASAQQFDFSSTTINEINGQLSVTLSRPDATSAATVAWTANDGTAKGGAGQPLPSDPRPFVYKSHSFLTNGAEQAHAFTVAGTTYVAVAARRSQVHLYRFDGTSLVETGQSLNAEGQVRHWETFVAGGETYLVGAVYQSTDSSFIAQSPVYRFDTASGQFIGVQTITTSAALRCSTHWFGGTLLLVFAENKNDQANTLIESKVYVWNPNTKMFGYLQPLSTRGAADVEFFERSNVLYLAIANSYDSSLNTYNTASQVWRYDTATSRFVATGGTTFTVTGAFDLHHFVIDSVEYLAVASSRDASGNEDSLSIVLRFDTTTQQFVPHQRIPTARARAVDTVVINGVTLLALANEGRPDDLYKSHAALYRWDANTQWFVLAELIATDAARGVSFVRVNTNQDFLFVINYGFSSFGLQSPVPSAAYRIGLVDPTAIDFFPTSGSVYFPAGQATATLTIGIVTDNVVESPETFTLTVPSTSSSTTVTITDDDVAIFTQSEYWVTVAEGQPVGSPVSPAVALVSPLPASGVTFAVSTLPEDGQAFAIGSSTGIVTTATTSLDRETRVRYDFAIEATTPDAPQKVSRARVFVVTSDVNDNSPVFAKSSYSVSLPEEQPINTAVITVTATDADSGAFGTVTYSLSAPSTVFAIDANTGLITTLQTIDRETAQTTSYALTVVATDSDPTPANRRQTSVSVTVTISDINDNAPIFNPSSYSAQVTENTSPGPVLVTAFASDADSFILNSIVVYRLEDLSGNPVTSPFRIDGSNGAVTATTALDAEVASTYNLRVRALDAFGSAPLHPVYADLTISIVDVNDNAPVFVGGTNLQASVLETAQVGHVVTTVNAVDADVTAQPIVFRIQPDNDLLAIHPSTGVVTLRQTFDSEANPTRQSATFTVFAKDPEGVESQATLTLALLNANDNDPVITNSASLSITVPESTTVGPTLVTVQANDPDVGGAVTFSLASASTLFTVHPTTGAVSLLASLDFESQTSHTLFVRVTDNGSPTRSVDARVSIAVTDVNDNAPRFGSSSESATVAENVALNTVIFTAGAVDDDVSTVFNTIAYSIASGNTAGRFAIGSSSGEVSVVASLDRELVASYTLTIAASDGRFSTSQQLTVTVTDVNDNSPVFEPVGGAGNSITLRENQGVNSPVVTVRANDPDLNANGFVTYQLCHRPNTVLICDPAPSGLDFKIGATTGAITTAINLDYESVTEYLLQVRASDGGGRSTDLTLRILITNENDNLPVFRAEQWVVQLPESLSGQLTRGLLVAQPATNTLPLDVSATDADAGTFGTVTYSLVASAAILNRLSINANTGVLSLSAGFDREGGFPAQFTVSVRATDGGGITVSQVVTFEVADVNDNSPVFVNPNQQVDMLTDDPIGTAVASVTATDADATDTNSRVAYQITAGNSEQKFEINADTGAVTIKQQFTVAKDYTLTVQASNPLAAVGLTATTTLTVRVFTANPGQPTFVQSSYLFTPLETAALNSKLGTVIAFDSDSSASPDGQLAFSLDASSDQGFELSASRPSTSVPGAFEVDVLLEQPLDYETKQTHQIRVLVTDLARSPKSSGVDVGIVVQDVNDRVPVFTQAEWRVSVVETPNQATIVTVTATDADSAPNAIVRYRITSVVGTRSATAGGGTTTLTPTSSVATITEDGGTITTVAGILDFETWARFELTLQAYNPQEPNKFGTAKAIITVLDANDNTPTLVNAPFDVTVPESLGLGSVVATVQAADSDSGDNAVLRFAITAGNNQDLFDMDASSGQVVLVAALDHETATQHVLTIVISDLGTPARSVSTDVTVDVTDVNDNLPVFSGTPYTVVLVEGAQPGPVQPTQQPIGATDADKGGAATNDLRFSLTNNANGLFTINELTGALQTTASVDRETLTGGTAVVAVTDGANVVTATVTFTVTDVDDETPAFANPPSSAQVPENNGRTQLATFSVTDPDSISNLQFAVASVTPSSVTNLFEVEIDPATASTTSPPGIVQTFRLFAKGSLDREATPSITVVVSASDSARTVTASLVLTVVDVNDNSPVFATQPAFTWTVAENTAASGPTFPASDADAGANGAVTYSLVNTLGGAVAVNSATGQLSTSGLDREAVNVGTTVTLTLVASDTGVPPRSTLQVVVLTVVDQNDNSPQLSRDLYEANVLESISIGTVLTTLVATDGDEPGSANAQLTFAFASTVPTRIRSLFAVNPTTGNVTTIDTLDRETDPNGFEFLVEVADAGTPQRKDSATVKVVLIDVNDNPPEFTNGQLQATSVFENTATGFVVATVTATSKDAGQNAEITYSLENTGNELGHFAISATSGEVRVAGSIDREAKASYVLIVRATDGGSPPLSSTAQLDVTVLDVNDETPVFTSPSQVSVSEGAPLGFPILTVTAQDRDEGRNAQVSITMTPHPLFAFAPATGIVTVKSKLDFDGGQFSHQLLFEAADNGTTPRRNIAGVNVLVQDINDEVPTFQVSGPFGFSEAAVPPAVVGQVRATDRDLVSSNNVVSYAIVSGNAAGLFSLNSTTGDITLLSPVDRETTDQYVLVVSASDNGLPQLSTSAQVTLNVLDDNDNTPVILNTNFAVSVEENLVSEVKIFQLQASDSDIGLNGQLRFEIAVNDAMDSFRIDEDTGDVFASDPLDREFASTITLTLRVSDRATVNPRSATAQLVVTVLDLNDNAPIFVPGQRTFTLAENVAVGTLVTTLPFTDRDTAPNQVSQYRIVSGDPSSRFRVTDLGRLEVSNALDRELTDSHRLEISVFNRNYSSTLFTTTVVVVNVGDVNDNNPVITNAPSQVALVENATPELVALTATDADLASSTSFTFSIVDADFRSHFSMSNDGTLSVDVPFDFEFLKQNLSLPVPSTAAALNVRVVVSDGHAPTPRDSQVVTIVVVVHDTNDNTPKLTGPISATVAENLAAGAFVARAQATDADSGDNARIQYSLVGSADRTAFDINPQTGRISTAQPLNREAKASYAFSVKAQDFGSPTNRSDTTEISVSVADVNDNTPQFAAAVQLASIAEDAVVGVATVTTVAATDADQPNTPASAVYYRIVSGDQDGRFAIHNRTGVITVAGTLDRETEDFYTLVVEAFNVQPLTLPLPLDQLEVRVTVLDANDNDPVFGQAEYNFTVAEDAGTTTLLGSVAASDNDLGLAAEVEYVIAAGNTGDAFAVDSASGALTIKSPLDREVLDTYTLTVQAVDKGSPRRVGTTTVRVDVTDVNDETPYFPAGTQYAVTVPENQVPVDAVLLTLLAQDNDIGANAWIQYSIDASSPDAALFQVNSTTGELAPKFTLDREAADQRVVGVVATDAGQPSRSSKVTVTVTVTDLNDNRPLFKPHASSVTVGELAQFDTKVFQFEATDADVGSNAAVSFQLVGDADAQGSFAATLDGGIFLIAPLDRAVKDSFDLQVEVRNPGTTLKDQTTLSVIVTDENFNAPVFSQTGYSASVAENSATGTAVVTVAATDADPARNGVVRFALGTGTSASLFAINATTGAISVAGPLDRETAPWHVITVVAQDQATTPKQTSVQVNITVTDVNDNSPTFAVQSQQFGFTEGFPVGQVFGTVEATDADIDTVTYGIVAPADTRFSVDPAAGTLSLLVQLDRETAPSETFQVSATDKAGHAALLDVTILVGDENDNPPLFASATFNATVQENVPQTVGTYVASDADLFPVITYTVEGPDAALFSIDSSTGVLVVRLPGIDFEKVTHVNVTLRATDQGGLTSTAVVVITVADGNDNPPKFAQALYQATLQENVPVNTAVLFVLATDADTGVNSQIRYSLQGADASRFVVTVASDGRARIATNAVIDREAKDFHRFSLIASDGLSSALATVEITVTDVNDNSPVFAQSPFRFNVLENSVAPTLLGRVNATDSDAGVWGTAGITYLLEDGPGSSDFSLDSSNGQLTALVSFDREQTSVVELSVIAADGASPPRIRAVTVLVSVVGINDNPPVFSKDLYVFNVSEATSIGALIGSVTADDEDQGVVTELLYTTVFTGGSDSARFVIDSTSGALKLDALLDRETREVYDFQVTVRDANIPSLTDTTAVRVVVLDANDVAPTFVSGGSNTATLLENVAPGTRVLQLSATDGDVTTANNQVTFSLTISAFLAGVAVPQPSPAQAGPQFAIDRWSGVINTTAPLDRETADRYVLAVTVADSGSPQLSASTLVTVFVQDVNDNNPVITSGTEFTVPENALLPALVTVVTTTDADLVQTSVRYSVVSESRNGTFRVNPVSGRLTIEDGFDSEFALEYFVTVRATDAGGRFSEATIKVIAGDINDNAPVFNLASYKATVVEGTTVPSLITITATDEDRGLLGTSGIRFSIVATSSPFADHFSVTTEVQTVGGTAVFAVGKIAVVEALDREAVDVVVLTVEATDDLGQGLSSFTTVNVSVTDINDNAPAFVTSSLAISVAENAGPNILIGRLQATDADPDAQLSFFTSSLSSPFTVEPNGNVLARRSFDYEVEKQLSVPVFVVDGGQPTSGVLVVRITDVNDNTPVFSQVLYSVTLAENEPAGELVTLSASDADAGINAALHFTLLNHTDKFAVNATSGVVSALGPFDFESGETQYSFDVRVEDGAGLAGANARSAKTRVEVTLDDRNDNTPEFQQAGYSATVTEHAATGTPVVVTIKATDADGTSINSNVRYSFDPALAASSFFSIHPVTGAVTVAKDIDRETPGQASFALTVFANDTGTEPRQRWAKVTLNVAVLDINDQPPLFRTPPNVTVCENSVGVGVTTFVVDDADIGANAVSTFRIVSGNDDGAFAINATTGLLTTVSLDRERQQSYVLQIEAINGPSFTSTVGMYVEVCDRNDNAPLFVPSNVIIASVLEGAGVGTIVTTVRATDADLGNNGRVAYSLIPTPNSAFFDIDPTTGRITVASLGIDRETFAQVNLTVQARDFGSPVAQTSLAEVRVIVDDANDNSPIFSQTSYSASIPENPSPGTFVLVVLATDADANTVSYSILETTSAFRINSATGVITTRLSLDREFQAVRTFTVVASDSGSPPRQSAVTVTVTLTDINDNAPRFVNTNAFVPASLRTNAASLDVSEATPAGTRLLQFATEDLDEGVNAQTSLTIVAGNEDNSFSLVTGLLSLAKQLDHETRKTVQLLLRASNPNAAVPQSTDYTVDVTVLDVNDNAPIFTPPSLTVRVSEATARDTSIVFPSADDIDSTVNGFITYSLVNTFDGLFSIDALTGVVALRGSLDREQRAAYNLTVIGRDGGSPARQTALPVRLIVEDVNDEAPEFPFAVLDVSLFEEVPVGTEVVVVQAEEFDEDPAGFGLRYNIEFDDPDATTPNAPFAMDELTGNLTVAGRVDREAAAQFIVTVRATDAANLSSTMVVRIAVVDLNDNSPEFPQPAYGFDLPENVPGPVTLGRVGATDRDQGSAGSAGLQYSILESPMSDKFSVDSTGLLVATSRFDFEQVQLIPLAIRAQDSGTPPRSAFVSVTVSITDVNDNAPTFANNNVRATVSENLVVGTEVVAVPATDADATALNSNVTYTLSAFANVFAIDDSTGMITTRVVLDREAVASYAFDVLADDQRGLIGRITVTVTVEDVNDNVPVFDPTQDFEVLVSEGAKVGDTLFTAKATDADAGNNSKLSYRFGDDLDLGGHFEIDANTGVVTLKAKLDREVNSMILMHVIAEDGGAVRRRRRDDNGVSSASAPTSSVTCNQDTFYLLDECNGPCQVSGCVGQCSCESFMILVTDINDNVPVVVATPTAVSVAENVSVGHEVVRLTGFDPDANEAGQFSFSFRLPQNAFAIDATSGVITTSAKLDFETRRSYTLDVVTVDQGSPPLSSIFTLRVDVTDVNDNAPVFVTSTLTFTVAESAPINGEVGVVKATDADGDGTGNVLMQLTSASDTFFVSPSGAITLLKALDRETTASYTLQVQGVDTGSPPLRTDATVTITVSDENDNAPVFSKSVYTASVPEGLQVALEVVTVSATDPDEGNSGTAGIRYSIVDGPFKSFFAFDPISGRIVARKAFDYETNRNVTIRVQAVDDLGLGLSSEAVVQVTVLDVNDNPPVFTQEVYTVSVSEDVLPNSFVTTVLAVDADSVSSSPVVYSFSTGQNLFNIDATSGVITTARLLDREAGAQVTLVVSASDGDRNSVATVVVTLLDVNDNAPQLVNPPTLVSVAENQPSGTLVVQLQATDVDENDVLTFRLVQPSAAFDLVASTGAIRTKVPLDREQTASYVLSVQAVDASGKATPTAQITVNVTDINDEAPVFGAPTAASLLQFQVSQGISFYRVSDARSPCNAPFELCPGYGPLRVFAADADAGVNGQVTYSKDDTAASNNFLIDANTGVLTLLNGLDRDQQAVYTFQVFARDAGTPSRSTSATVVIELGDGNDNAPQFGASIPSTVTVAEDTAAGTVVVRAAATDADAGAFGTVTYTMSEATGSLRINSTTGEIAVVALDYEQHTQLAVTVTARDGGSPPLQTTLSLTVRLTDVNDFTPALVSSTLDPITVSEIVPDGTPLRLVYAQDGDATDQHALVSYAVAGPASPNWFRFVSHPSGTLTSPSEPRLLSASGVTYQSGAGASNTYNLQLRVSNSASNNPLASTDSLLVFVVPMFAATDTNDLSKVRINYQIPDPCGDDPLAATSVHCQTTTSRRRRFRSSPTSSLLRSRRETLAPLKFEVWTRRSTNCVASQCPRLTYVGQSSTLCECLVYGEGTAGFDPFARTFVLSGLTPGSSAEYQVRALRDGSAVFSTPYRLYQAPLFGPLDATIEVLTGGYRVSWTAPSVINGQAGTAQYRVCFCPSSVDPRSCTCEHPQSEGEPENGFTTETSVTIPKSRLSTAEMVNGANFVVELSTLLADNTRSVTRTIVGGDTALLRFAATDVSVQATTPQVNGQVLVSWQPSSDLTAANLVTNLRYRVCRCQQTFQCACGEGDALTVSAGATATQAVVPVVVDETYIFVVENDVAFSDGSQSTYRSTPVIQTQPFTLETSSSKIASSSIAGIVIAALVLLILIILIVVYHRRRQDKQSMYINQIEMQQLSEKSPSGSPERITSITKLKANILHDSQLDLLSHGEVNNTSAYGARGGEMPAAEQGYWDYFVEERAAQFWPESVTDEDPHNDSSYYDEPNFVRADPTPSASTSLAAPPQQREFGMRSTRVMSDSIGGRLVPQGGRSRPLSDQHGDAAEEGAPDTKRNPYYRQFTGEEYGPTTIATRDLRHTFDRLLAQDAISAEFSKVKADSAEFLPTFHAATETYNVRKNRYGNVLPNDNTRVKLSHTGHLGSDYINANYVDGWKRPKGYIATQGPVPTTIGDFWRMVWEQNSGVIVMATREVEMDKVKCHKYWPDDRATLQCGDLEILNQRGLEEIDNDIGVRRLVLRHVASPQEREVTQLVFRTWPDHGVPDTPASVLKLVHHMRQAVEYAAAQGSSGPAVLHCSAGIGRTGALIAIDVLTRRATEVGNVDVPATVMQMRSARQGCVQSGSQYQFIYEAVLAYLEEHGARLLADDEADDTAYDQGGYLDVSAAGDDETEARALIQALNQI